MSSHTPSYYWSCMTLEAPFAGRDGAGLLAFHDRLWLLGGWNPGDKEHFPRVCNSEVWSSRDGIDWVLEVPQAPWEGRHTAGYAVFQDRMWIVGGDCIQGHYQDDVWNSIDGVHWNLVTDQVPWGPRALHYTAAFADRLWVMGGQTIPPFAPEPEVFYHDVCCSGDGAHWERMPEAPPWAQRGMIGGSAVLRDRVWVLGGGTYDTPDRPDRLFYNDVWSTADGLAWENHGAAPWHPRQYHEVAAFDGRLWVLEGWNHGNRNDVWYSADGECWHELPDTPWAPRHAASVAVFADALWVIAGNNMFPDVWKLESR